MICLLSLKISTLSMPVVLPSLPALIKARCVNTKAGWPFLRKDHSENSRCNPQNRFRIEFGITITKNFYDRLATVKFAAFCVRHKALIQWVIFLCKMLRFNQFSQCYAIFPYGWKQYPCQYQEIRTL